MQSTLVLTVIGSDRPGLVQAIAKVVGDHGGNWEASRMARLSGRFAGILRVAVDPERADTLRDALADLGPEGLKVVVEGGADERGELDAYRVKRIELLGADHPGIIREITAVLARLGVSVVELATDLRDAPMAGGTLFAAHLELRCPEEVSSDLLRENLEGLGDSLMVDIKLDV